MNRSIRVTARATADVDSIYGWIKAHTSVGANRWHAAFLQAMEKLRVGAHSYAVAPEAAILGISLRQILFKTPNGRTYRALFQFDEQNVYIVGIRGAGQDLAGAEEIEIIE